MKKVSPFCISKCTFHMSRRTKASLKQSYILNLTWTYTLAVIKAEPVPYKHTKLSHLYNFSQTNMNRLFTLKT